MSRSNLAKLAPGRIERFLMALANLRDDDASALSAIGRMFGDMLADVPSAAEWDSKREAATVRVLSAHWAASSTPSDWTTHVPAHSFLRFGPHDEIQEFARISDLSTQVRRIWQAETLKEKGHRAFLLEP